MRTEGAIFDLDELIGGVDWDDDILDATVLATGFFALVGWVLLCCGVDREDQPRGGRCCRNCNCRGCDRDCGRNCGKGAAVFALFIFVVGGVASAVYSVHIFIARKIVAGRDRVQRYVLDQRDFAN